MSLVAVQRSRPRLKKPTPPARLNIVHPTSTAQPLHPIVQAKLRIGAPNDKYEQEGDRMANQVMRMAEPGAPAVSNFNSDISPGSVQRTYVACACGGTCPKCEEELRRQPMKEKDELQAKRTPGNTPAVTPQVQAQVDSLRGGGRPLDPATRAFMEPRFGYDFSRVRVHSGATADRSARDINARAYTTGHNIVFGAGRFAPGTHEGRRLIAHELMHVVQQSDRIGNSQRNVRCGPSSISDRSHGPETNSGTLLQRDLALEPTNPNPQEVNLTAGEIRDAINFNRRRYDAANTRLIQDVVGAPQTGIFDEETIRLIARYQDDFGLTPVDGKVGAHTFDQLTTELQAENVDDQTCLTMFDVSDPTDPLDIRVAGPGLADIFSQFNVTARFSPHCGCDEFDYRQFICGSVDRTQGGVVTNINNLFLVPGGGLPQCPGWVEDGNTSEPQNGRYGHRNHSARVNNRYLDDTGTVDMASGCRFEAFDTPGVFSVPGNSGDRYDFDVRFFGDVRRNGRRMQRKFWAVRDNLTIP